MATRIQEGAPSTLQRTHVFTTDITEALASAPPARLFGRVGEEPFVETSPPVALARQTVATPALQRCLDVALATLFLLILWPVMLGATLLVLLGSRGPAFYSQPRVGLNGEIFGCLKFRTMLVGADRLLEELLESSPALKEIWMRDRKLRNDPRITPFGHFLRRYSIDELPQLFNVLRGDMSIVGPRPIAIDEAAFYADEFSTYCSVKPGLTGPWQVGGRNAVSYDARVRLDAEYARTKSILQDLRLLLRTVPVVLRGTGI